MTPKYFIGIDISKVTLDFAVYSQGHVLSKHKIDNTEASVKNLLKALKGEYNCSRVNSILCAESMGIYATYLLKACLKKRYGICLESPLQIKRSLGIQRGKNDALDALRIAQYACKNYKSLRMWEPPRTIIEDLKHLSTIRRKLIKVKKMLCQTGKLEDYFLTKPEIKKIQGYSETSRREIERNITTLEQKMTEIIDGDERLRRLMELITSVPRIGPVIGCQIIVYTNEFLTINNPKKFASYCGVVPFEYTSGTSVKGKAKISKYAVRREFKGLLHMAALGALQIKNSFLKRYYDRKVKEGKNKMSVLNAIRNKLIHRVFACVRDNKLYEEPKLL